MPLPVRGFFTYELPDNFTQNIEIGQRVLVQFGNKKLYTVIAYAIHNNKPTDYETKPILDILDKKPIVNKFQIRLWEWSADYYMCSIGDFYKAALPSGLRLESETKILPKITIDTTTEFTAKQKQVINLLSQQDILTIADIAKISDVKNPIALIKELHALGAITIQEEVKNRYKPKLAKYIVLAKKIDTPEKITRTLELLSKAKKQHAFFQFYINYVGIEKAIEGTRISKQKLIEKAESTPAILKQLLEKNILKETVAQVSRISEESKNIQTKKELNPNQEKALIEINENFKTKDVVLLHGVTSSGKTEIYIHKIEEALKENKQVLYLLPEIALTSQIIQRLKAVFGSKVGVYHSKFSDDERVEIWQNVLANTENSYQIILGVRSSIFLPFSNLGLIIVDEEHENTFKQFDPSPRYNARDLSVVLAALHKAKVLLGTATPSLESYYNSQTERYGLVELFQRHKDVELPKIMLSDIRKAHKKKEMRSHFSPMMIDNIEEALNKNEQVILFQNRRGFSPFLECNSCGWVPGCKWCDVSLTYHKGINKLVCHYCGYSINGVHYCEKCKEPGLETKGFGTEKVEDEISLIFPDAKVGRLDLDTARGKHGHETIINEFQDQNIDILIGTQMISKGLDFEHVSIVGILSADSMLRFPDFRAYERSYQLMAQVSGRAGRKNKQGKVIIQTYDTENIIVNQVVHNNYRQMYDYQLKERKQFFYPPFSRLIKLTLKHRDKNVLNKVSYELANQLKVVEQCKILGPTTPVIIRIQNYYIKNILIKVGKGPQIGQMKKDISTIITSVNSKKDYKTTQIIIDVDPF
jgi:primosomal protein N' (replication factor Y)